MITQRQISNFIRNTTAILLFIIIVWIAIRADRS